MDLIVSAFPDDYSPTPTSLIGKRHAVGVNVADLARDKAVDLREFSACWLSRFVHRPDLHFSRILCFEPARKGRRRKLRETCSGASHLGGLGRRHASRYGCTARRAPGPAPRRRLLHLLTEPLTRDSPLAESARARHFVLTGVLMRRPFTHLEGLLDVKYDVLEEGLDLEYFHASEDRQAVRDRVFRCLAAHGSRMRMLCVVTDSLPVRSGGAAVRKAVRATLKVHTPTSVSFRILHHASRADVNLQVADYCAWAALRRWEREDDRSYRIIADAGVVWAESRLAQAG